MPLIDHLVELRQRLVYSIAGLLVAFFIAFYFSDAIFAILMQPLWNATSVREVITTSPQEFFFVKIRVAFYAAMFMAFPIIATQLWMFVAPGLYRHEQAAFRPFLIATPIMFAIGAAFAYLFVIPVALGFFDSLLGTVPDLGPGTAAVTPMPEPTPPVALPDGTAWIQPGLGQAVAVTGSGLAEAVPGAVPGGPQIVMSPRAAEYLSFVMALTFAFGIAFETPVVLTLLVRAGLISAIALAAKRRYAIVIIFVLAAILTPPDPLSQIALAVPMVLLYEISIQIARQIERARVNRQALAEAA